VLTVLLETMRSKMDYSLQDQKINNLQGLKKTDPQKWVKQGDFH